MNTVLKICEILTDEEITKTAKQSLQGAAITGFASFAGALLLGRKGILAGKCLSLYCFKKIDYFLFLNLTKILLKITKKILVTVLNFSIKRYLIENFNFPYRLTWEKFFL